MAQPVDSSSTFPNVVRARTLSGSSGGGGYEATFGAATCPCALELSGERAERLLQAEAEQKRV